MSQTALQHCRSRAVFAAVAICALVFSLLMSGASKPAHAGLSVAERGAACVYPGASPDYKPSPPSRSGANHTDCPDCCLAAIAGAAVLPERIATLSRPPQLVSSPVLYSAVAVLKLETAASSAVNGARAPPAPFAAS